MLGPSLPPLPSPLQLKQPQAPQEQEGVVPSLEIVALHALLLCEALFDPYQTWRCQQSR